MNLQLIHRFAVLAGLCSTAACLNEVAVGSGEQALSLSADDRDICATYCEAAGEVDCPRQGDCLAICASLRAESPACEPELDEFIACAATMIVPETCGYHEPWDDPCLMELDEYNMCWDDDEDHVTRELRDVCSWPDPYENGGWWCDFAFGRVVLDADCEEGVCECLVNGGVVDTCTNLVHATDFSQPSSGCCAERFAAIFGG